jgi:2-oxoisovalerate dehydrogenase E1 component beta subunit
VSALPIAHAVNQGLRDAMEADAKVLLIGEDFGEQRVVDSPLGEAGIVGSAIGLAMAGYRPVCEIQFDGFVFPAMNQIITQLAKYRHRSEGTVSLPVVIRIPVGGGIGAIEHHSESPEAYFAHTAGLKVMSPSSAQEAYDQIGLAIRSDDPVIFLEPKRSYWLKGEVDTSAVATPAEQAKIVRPGDDLTLVVWGALVPVALKVAEVCAEEGRSIEVIDLRSLSPIDDATLLASLERTGRLVVAHEASQTLGLGAEIAARMQQQAFYSLEAPILRVTGYDTPYPASRLEEDWLPGLDRILDAIDQSFDQ